MLETERKYIIEYPDTQILLKQPGCTVGMITQDYLISDGELTRRVRSTVINGDTVYHKNTKKRISPMTCIEDESEIDQKEYVRLLLERDPELNTVYKTRYTFYYLGQKFEVDVYPFWHGTAICETELKSEDERVTFPNFIKIKKEVTGDRKYSNRSMAKAVPEE